MKITVKQLRDLDACETEVDKFRELFGSSVEMTEALCVVNAQWFSWDWAADQFLSAPAHEEYWRVRALASGEYWRVTTLAREEYRWARALTCEERERVTALAWEEAERMTALAWEELQRVKAQTFGRLAEEQSS